MGRLQVVPLSREGEGRQTPSVSWTVLIMAPCGPRQKSQVGITVCSFVAGGATEAGTGLQAQPLLPSPQQASCLFALEIVLSQVTVKVAVSRDDILHCNHFYQAARNGCQQCHCGRRTQLTPSTAWKCLNSVPYWYFYNRKNRVLLMHKAQYNY